MPAFIAFASDATIVGMWGAALLALSLAASWGERRRTRRSQVDAVGVMPWRDIAALSSFAGLVLLAFAALGWLRG